MDLLQISTISRDTCPFSIQELTMTITLWSIVILASSVNTSYNGASASHVFIRNSASLDETNEKFMDLWRFTCDDLVFHYPLHLVEQVQATFSCNTRLNRTNCPSRRPSGPSDRPAPVHLLGYNNVTDMRSMMNDDIKETRGTCQRWTTRG
eukprot:scaffold76373_cov65-Cyclotella_meneghiniana.AAC.8